MKDFRALGSGVLPMQSGSRPRTMVRRGSWAPAVSALFAAVPLFSGTPIFAASVSPPENPAEHERFEQRIRPVLVEECYECHRTGGKIKGGLAVDHRDGLLLGGDSGPALVPGDAEASLLIRALRHIDGDLAMPRGRPRLDDSVLADFTAWVNNGAFDPRDAPPPAGSEVEGKSWETLREERRQWWSFQPIDESEPPAIEGKPHPVDRFIAARLTEAGLTQSRPADAAMLARRVSFVLTGLPPTPEQLDAFLDDARPGAYERFVDSLLYSPHYGERWARHWMDWFRYAESHGSEGDPPVPLAWRYRDYLIRALNADVPYDQLVREHLAGDLLAEPRIDAESGLNESAFGPAHLRMVFHGFAPTDALDEQVRFTDNQIDVTSKALLGLTVSCARCHDHKFDPISQRDFYAWYGVFASGRPILRTVNAPGTRAAQAERLAALKGALRERLAAAWSQRAEEWKAGRDSALPGPSEDAPTEALLRPLRDLHDSAENVFAEGWQALRLQWEENLAAWKQWRTRAGAVHWPAASEDKLWHAEGSGVAEGPAPAGSFAVLLEGSRILDDILPSGWYSHLTSPRDSGIVLSRHYLLEVNRDLYVRAAGAEGALTRYAVQSYPRDGTVYPVKRLEGGQWTWSHWNLGYWTGDRIHVEISTALDQPVLSRTDGPPSWFGLREALLVPAGSGGPPAEDLTAWTPIFESNTVRHGGKDLSVALGQTLQRILDAWRSETLDDAEAAFLSLLLRTGALSSDIASVPGSEELMTEYRRLERELPAPLRVPGILDADIVDQPLFERGNHRQPRDPVPRGFLEVLSTRPYPGDSSGRQQLAEDILAPGNPLTPRVIVNRLWHHVFGRGIVASPDNFGRLGREPSHPELLDYLALRFVREGWSIRSMLRFLVLSETFRATSTPPPGSDTRDPDGALLSYFPVRRLEAEAIRDGLLAASGSLDRSLFGPPVASDSPRRSVYLRVFRNDLDPFLAVFDSPEPHTTTGSRDATNVPAQSLALLNDPFVIRLAGAWAGRIVGESSLKSDKERIKTMFRQALGRDVKPDEVQAALAYLESTRSNPQAARQTLASLKQRESSLQTQIAALREAVRLRLPDREEGLAPPGPAEIPALWEIDFAQTPPSSGEGAPPLELHGGARIAKGALVLDGETAWASAGPLPKSIKAKTLEAWVVPANLDQRGGGVLAVQTRGGAVFDALVFGEREPRRWLAGSNGFERTQDFGGPAENGAFGDPVHLAIVWGADGTVAGFREGRPYGKPYQSSVTQFDSRSSEVVLGLRHDPPAPGKLFAGRIYRARLFDRALSPEEIEASAEQGPRAASRLRLVEVMTSEEREVFDGLEHDLALCSDQIARLVRDMGATLVPGHEWTDLAQALFNLKEFIYLH